jgi:hypothetical protein
MMTSTKSYFVKSEYLLGTCLNAHFFFKYWQYTYPVYPYIWIFTAINLTICYIHTFEWINIHFSTIVFVLVCVIHFPSAFFLIKSCQKLVLDLQALTVGISLVAMLLTQPEPNVDYQMILHQRLVDWKWGN